MARRARESAHFPVKIFSSHQCLSAVVPAFAEPDIHLLPRAGFGPRRRLSWCSLPVPKQSVGSLGRVLRRSLGQGETWQSARFRILRFSFRCGFLCRCRSELSQRLKVSLLAIYSHEISHQFASHSECCAIGIPLQPRVLVYQSQIRISPWRQLRRFDEHPLNMFVPLLRNWCTRYFVGGSFFISAKPAVADGLPDRSKT